MSRTTLAAVAFALLLLGLIVYAMKGLGRQTCEVCIEYGGRTECRTAKGADRNEALRAATDNACSFLAQGMDESMRCSHTPPSRVKCE